MCSRAKYFVVTCCTLIILCQAVAKKDNQIREKLRTTGLLSDCFPNGKSDSLILASTLDGDLHALSSETGAVMWTLQDDPVVKNPKESSKSSLARFFPNPRDGSLYRYTLGTPDHPLKKLPFTIPQLVENSPCRSTDGLFYLGKKVDSFTVVNRATGDKQLVLGMQNILEQCTRSPAIPRAEMLFIGRTMYNVMLYEQDTGNRWNVSFYDYTTTSHWEEEDYEFLQSICEQLKDADVELVHYAAAGSGTLMTLDKASESLVWTAHLDSPIVALFSITPDGNLMSVPMTVVASPTLQRYLREILRRGSFLLTAQSHMPLQQLNPSIYLGESLSGSTYAIPSLVDDQMATIKRRLIPRLLLDGPDGSSSLQAESKPSENKKMSSPNSNVFNFEEKTQEYSSSSANPFSSVWYTKPSAAADAGDQSNVALQDDDDFPVASQSYRIEDGLFSHCMMDDAVNPDDVVVLGHYTVPEQLPQKMFPLPTNAVPLGITHLTADGREWTGHENTGQHVEANDGYFNYINRHDAKTPQGDDKSSSNDAIWTRNSPDWDPKSSRDPLSKDGISDSSKLAVRYRPRGPKASLGNKFYHLNSQRENFGNSSSQPNVIPDRKKVIRAEKRVQVHLKAPPDVAPHSPPLRYYSWATESFIVGAGLFMVLGLIYCIYMIHDNLRRVQGGSAQAASGRSGGGSRGSQGAGAGGGEGEVTAQLEEQDDGTMRVGKITYEPSQQIGKGSEGTVVYRGAFEGRVAAVKRVLPNCYRIAAREVQLLRSSDHHPNVIRYLCTEQCREFRYIALELCDATLEHYVQHCLDALPPCPATDKLVVQQATRGVAHLHSLNIVHRDIKPSNVLLQLPKSVGCGDVSTTEVGLRVLISDFGLCKQLEAGHGSFTKHSGITGTDGWIAPEMIRLDLEDQRPTRAVDIFSLGCLFYYVVTGGQHPYGHDIVRQGNIASGNNDLSGTSDACLTDLLRAMLSRSPKQRPPARAILRHPYFWDSALTLNFLVDVSDRVDKFPNDSASTLLEEDSESVAGQWVAKMHPDVYTDLRLHRDYRDSSVKDLLRAIRNKRTHYQELHASVQAVMGSVPVEFLHYWTSRFPSLVHHVWRVMHCCRHEHAFAKYYSSKHVFHHIKPCVKLEAEQSCSPEAPSDPPVRPKPPVGIHQGLNSQYSTVRLGTRSFLAYNQKRAKYQYLQQIRSSDPFQSAFNKALDDGNWRAAASPPDVPPPKSEGTANAPWLLRKKKTPRIIQHPSDVAPAHSPPNVATPAKDAEVNSSGKNCALSSMESERQAGTNSDRTSCSKRSRTNSGVSYPNETSGAESNEENSKLVNSGDDLRSSESFNSSPSRRFHSPWGSADTEEEESEQVNSQCTDEGSFDSDHDDVEYQTISDNMNSLETSSESQRNDNRSIAVSDQRSSASDIKDSEDGSPDSASGLSELNVRAKRVELTGNMKLSNITTNPEGSTESEPVCDSESTELRTHPWRTEKTESPDMVNDVKEDDASPAATNSSNSKFPASEVQRARKKKKKR